MPKGIKAGSKAGKRSVKELHDYITDYVEPEKVVQQADDMDLDSMESGIAHQIMHTMKQHCFSKDMAKLLEAVHVNIDFLKLVPLLHELKTAKNKTKAQKKVEKYWDNLGCEFCSGKHADIYEENFDTRINFLMKKKKIIFLNMGMSYYFVDLDEEDKYSDHGTCAVLIPQKNGYHMYYINSHGHDMKDNTSYETIGRTRRSLKTMKFDVPIDVAIMKSFIAYMKKEHKKTIRFENDTEHVYYGVDMQAGDNVGCCYIYPWIIYYNIGRYYDQKRVLTIKHKKRKVKRSLSTVATMLQGGNLQSVVQNMFLEYNHDYALKSVMGIPDSDSEEDEKEYMLGLEKIIENDGDYFVYGLIHTVVMFMKQFSKL